MESRPDFSFASANMSTAIGFLEVFIKTFALQAAQSRKIIAIRL